MTAKVHRVLQALPTTLNKLGEGVLEARRRRDDAVLEGGRVFVALPVQRAEHAFAEFGSFFQHRLGSVETSVFKPRQLRDLVDVGQVTDVEQHVGKGGGVAHGDLQNRKHTRSGGC